MKHPGDSYAYKLMEAGKSMIFATDTEITEEILTKDADLPAFFEGADLLILDSQYTLEESFKKFDWGHTAYTMAVNLAVECGIKILVLFHHEPRYKDREIWNILRSSRTHLKNLTMGMGRADSDKHNHLKVLTAVEGMEIKI